MNKAKIIHNGYSLLELLTCLGILSLLFIIGSGFYSQFIKRNVLDERVSTLVNAIKFSQNQAILSGNKLMLSPISHSNGWQKGMILMAANEENKPLSEINILRKWQWHNDKYINMSWQGLHSDVLLFSNDINSASLSGSFILSQDQQIKRKIVINRIGRIRVENTSEH